LAPAVSGGKQRARRPGIIMSSTPRAQPASPRAAPATSKTAGDKKPKAKKPKGAAPTAPVSLGMPIKDPEKMDEADAKAQLAALQKSHGTLVVAFNNQQAELAQSQKQIMDLEAKLSSATKISAAPESAEGELQQQLDKALGDLRAAEASNMAMQKKINQLQVEHVSEEEVDQLFYALEQKEQQLADAKEANEVLEQEVQSARQLSARGGGGDPKFIEIHHHNDISDDDDDDDAAKQQPVS